MNLGHAPFLLVIPLCLLPLGRGPGPGPSEVSTAGAHGPETLAAHPVRFNVDPAHSSVGFTVRHLGLSRVRGSFSTVSGTLMVDPEDVTRSSITMVVRTESLSTDNERRDNDLKENYFQVEEHPTALFRSTGVTQNGEGALTVEGDLTMKGVTRPVEVEVEELGTWQDPDSRTSRVGFMGRLVLDRKEFGISNPGSPAEVDLVIGDDVTLELEVEGVRNDPAGIAFASGEARSVGELLKEPLASGEIDRARTLFQEARDGDPESTNTGEREFLVLTVQLLWDGSYEGAAAAGEMGSELHPESTTLRGLRAEALWRAGRAESAEGILRSLVEEDPMNATALELLRWATM